MPNKTRGIYLFHGYCIKWNRQAFRAVHFFYLSPEGIHPLPASTNEHGVSQCNPARILNGKRNAESYQKMCLLLSLMSCSSPVMNLSSKLSKGRCLEICNGCLEAVNTTRAVPRITVHLVDSRMGCEATQAISSRKAPRAIPRLSPCQLGGKGDFGIISWVPPLSTDLVTAMEAFP